MVQSAHFTGFLKKELLCAVSERARAGHANGARRRSGARESV